MDERYKRFEGQEKDVKPSIMKAKPVFTCYKCGEPGHIKRNCPDLRRVIKEIRKEKRENKDADEASAKIARLGKWYNRFSMRESKNVSNWIVDSGATCHMCADESQFVSIDRKNVGKSFWPLEKK